MKAKSFRLSLAGLLALSFALPAAAFDLVGAWNAARGYDSGIASAQAARSAGQEQAVQGRAQLLPQVGLSANYTRNRPVEPAGISQYNSHGYGIQLTQPLFDVSKYATYRKGKAATRLADIQYDAAEQKLIVDVANAYFGVLLAQDTLAADLAAKNAYANQLAQAKTSFEVGTATRVDVDEAQAGYDAAVAKEIATRNQLEINREALRTLTGLNPDAIAPLAANMPLTRPTPDTLQPWVDQALVNSKTVEASQQQLELAKQDLLAKRGQRLPTVALSAGWQENRSDQPIYLGPQNTRGGTAGVNLTLPLFAGGGLNSQVREAAANELKAQDDLETARRQVRETVRQAYLGVTNGAALVEAQTQVLKSAKSKLDSTRLGKEVGVRTNLDLLQAEQAYYDAERTLAQARYSYLTAKLQLEQAAGILDGSKLASVNAVLKH